MSWARSVAAMLLAALFLHFVSVFGARADALETLTIVTNSGEHVYHVEIAKTEAEHAKGLMFRRYMPADRGMLFEFSTNAQVAFWMKNTYISLDMVFITPSGIVSRVVENAEPLSEALIPSGGPCNGVLELNGGAAAKIGLKAGDLVRADFFKS